jgi:lactate dehydrogenase-like 2-hydroxyacid dehydrogenase
VVEENVLAWRIVRLHDAAPAQGERFASRSDLLRRLMMALDEQQTRARQLVAIAEVSRKVAAILDLDTLFAQSDVVSLHCPLTAESKDLVNARRLAFMKKSVFLINTSRGGLIDTEAAIEALKSGQLGGLAIDVYEQEADLFFRDLSSTVISDDVFQRLLSFPNVIVTGHQAFFTEEAITTICETTINSVTEFATGQTLTNEIR